MAEGGRGRPGDDEVTVALPVVWFSDWFDRGHEGEVRRVVWKARTAVVTMPRSALAEVCSDIDYYAEGERHLAPDVLADGGRSLCRSARAAGRRLMKAGLWVRRHGEREAALYGVPAAEGPQS